MGAELRQEKSRHSSTENSLQTRLSKLQEDNDNTKGKLERMTKDLEESKKSDNAMEAKKLKDDNNSFQTQLAQL